MRLLRLVFLVALASGLAAIFINIVGFSDPEGPNHLSSEDLEALGSLRGYFKKCVNANGLGLQASSRKDPCEISMKFPGDTTPKWKDPKTGELEGLSFDFDLCEAVATWEQVRNSTTVLTREFIDALPNGWEEYAWQRINKGVLLNRCKNKTLCMEKLALVLPDGPPYVPRQFGRCAVIGNSGDLLKTKFGKEIDSYDAVLRENGAPIQNFSENVGTKSTFRLLNRGSAKALDKVAELYDEGKEVLIVKTTIHDIMNKMIQEIPILNPVYLMLGSSFGSAAKDPNRVVKWVPSHSLVSAARIASEKLLRRVGAGSSDPLAACSITAKKPKGKSSLASVSSLRKAAVEHQNYVRDATMYPLEHNPGHGLLCTAP
ncbi:sialyltransferase-like protein 2 isoform X2 [Primulina tabacum]|uniref:sialyltransferase-like protein 2 isoform X2 n=1 Tax=Primulina tabacum TaxID=48773 RepID=UPI003F5A22D5